jgi:UDP-glucose 4-epimerase
MTKKQAVLLGGAGFIGLHLTDRLLQLGWRVRIIDARLDLTRIAALPDQVEFYNLSLSRTQEVLDAIAGSEVCIHLIHNSRPNVRVTSPNEDIREVILPTVDLLLGLPPASLRNFIYLSSGGTVYGAARRLPVREDAPLAPISPYGLAKLTIEHHTRHICKEKGINALILRPGNLYGAAWFRERAQGAVEVFLRQILRGQPLQLLGDGSVVRDYLYIGDAVEAVTRILEHPLPATWNLGSGHGRSVLGLIALLERMTGRKAHIQRLPASPYDVPASVLDSSLLQAETGWRPQVGLDEGIARMLAGITHLEYQGQPVELPPVDVPANAELMPGQQIK